MISKKLIRHIILEEISDDGSFYKISPEEYLELMKLSGYHGVGISKLPKFGGKPLWITGTVNLSSTPTDSLGNVGYIDGNLLITNTKISTLGGTQVKGYVSDIGTPIERKRNAEILRKKRVDMNARRDNNDWDLDNPNIDDEGLRANALFEWLVGNNDIETLNDEDNEKLKQLKSEIKRLEDEEEYSEEIQDRIDELNDEIEELTDDKSDVYTIYPQTYTHYGLPQFEVLDFDGEFTVGTEDEMEEAALEYVKNLIDDTGVDSFNESFIENHIDTNSLKDYFEDWWRDDIYQNPEIYFNDDDFELTSEQEDRIEAIENEIAQYESEQSELDDSDEDYDYLYNDLQDKIDELESEKDEIIPDTDSPTDDMVESVLEDKLEDVENNPMHYIREYGLDLKYYVDIDELAEDMVSTDGWGVMNGYDGDYDSIYVNDEQFYIMRIN